MLRALAGLSGLIVLSLPAAAHTSDEDFEFWLNPTVTVALDENTSVKLDTAQRFRSEDNGRADTFFFRGWVQQQVSDDFKIGAAIERRFNTPGRDELRTMQQIDGSHGIFRTRLRFEQRFSEGRGGRMGLRLRPRAGISVPVSEDGKLAFGTDAELFWTLRGTSPGGDTGITGLRTQVSLKYKVSDTLSLSGTYLRQQDFRDNAPDTIGHAPLIGIGFSF